MFICGEKAKKTHQLFVWGHSSPTFFLNRNLQTLFTFVSWSKGRRKWQATPVFLPGKFYGQESGGLQSIALQRVGHLSTHAFLPQDERGYMWMEIWTGFIMSCCWMRYLVYRAELRARDRERDCPEGKIKQHRVRSQREPCFPCYATWRRCGWTNY